MKMRIVYCAYDNTQFSTREECEEYERPAIFHLNTIIRCIQCLDKDAIPMYCPAGLALDEALDWLNDAVQECTYIRIKEIIPSETLTFINNELDYYLPDNKVGLYKYDFENDKWVRVD